MSIGIRARAALFAAAVMTTVGTSVAVVSAQSSDAQQPPAATPSQEVQRVTEATTVLQEVLAAEASTIPRAVLEKAAAIVVLPYRPPGRPVRGEGPATRRLRFRDAIRARGILSVREDVRWSVPAFVTLHGGTPSGGDVILVVLGGDAVKGLLAGELKLASAVAGPVSAAPKTAAAIPPGADVLIYSRSREGLTGIALEKSLVRYDAAATKLFYGKAMAPADVIKQSAAPEPVPAWRAALEKHAPR
jgi:lipid-binding SYLF domain-containing protein